LQLLYYKIAQQNFSTYFMQQQRIQSIDALRGYAILTMVLSGSIAYAEFMPAFMFHAQVPPPNHVFHPEIPGITWVDLVFPFFLFSMGAAIPFSMQKKLVTQSWYTTVIQIFLRGVLLCFFAFFTQHIRNYANVDSSNSKWLLCLLAFILLHGIYSEWKQLQTKFAWLVRIVCAITGIIITTQLSFKNGSGFSFERVDIIILVLANMAVFGSFIWWATQDKPLLRILLLPFVMGIFLSSNADGFSFVKEIYNYSPAPFIYKFYYLKYLFIIIPGTLLGDWLLQFVQQQKTLPISFFNNNKAYITIALCLALIIENLWGLFTRHTIANASLTVAICVPLLLIMNSITGNNNIYKRCIEAGVYLLLLGLVFEAYEGGIKKDKSTYSYYFVTTGLAFLLVTIFLLLEKMQRAKNLIQYLAINGKNPMVAYVAGNLVVTPILSISGIMPYFNSISTNAVTGTLRGLLFTALVSVVTWFFVQRKWYWKS
jgi:predicted acyltransferase